MAYLLLIVALSLSAVAAWYAIAGLMAIFAAAAIPIAVMGGLLETSKLVIASWLYRNWKEIPKLMRAYFTFSLVVLMMLTSMGIFGFLSKAHLDQAIPTGDVAAKLALIDEKIRTEKENIDASRKELSQLDAQVDQTIGRTTDDKGTERAIAIRRGQQKDRARILNDIGQAQAKIAKYNEERAPIASEVRKVEAEVGPIKYIAAMIYDEKADTDVLEKAVRIVTLMIVIVFDPLAVLMLIAANWSLKNNNKPDWTKFFTKKREEVDLEELPDVKEIKIEDDINIGDKPDAWIADVGEKPTEEELKDLDVDIEEPKSEWSPELYKRDRHKMEPSKTKSFLNKIQKTLSGEKTIEKEVEELQDTTKKPVEYDSAGRRITP
jgi:hypothetical protein